jgi:HAD superfamily hydrolase (TIGR01509 family)
MSSDDAILPHEIRADKGQIVTRPMPNRFHSRFYREIDTLFLDVGGTLVSIDYAWVCKELGQLGVHCTLEQLQRAEAAARPLVSNKLARLQPGASEEAGTFEFYLRTTLEHLPEETIKLRDTLPAIAERLSPILRQPGRSDKLWSRVIPGVRDALTGFAGMGLTMVAVSNSDGTVERLLHDCGLHSFFCTVVDSHAVGYAKPDPRIFEHALAVSGSAAERTLHVGDMHYADIVGAEAAGIRAVLLDPFGDWTDVECVRVRDLPALQKEIAQARL